MMSHGTENDRLLLFRKWLGGIARAYLDEVQIIDSIAMSNPLGFHILFWLINHVDAVREHLRCVHHADVPIVVGHSQQALVEHMATESYRNGVSLMSIRIALDYLWQCKTAPLQNWPLCTAPNVT